jgi:hypothetical protein
MNRTVNLFLLLILGFSFIFPAAAIKYAQAEGATVITSQPNAKTFKCIDPTGKKLITTCKTGRTTNQIDISDWTSLLQEYSFQVSYYWRSL